MRKRKHSLATRKLMSLRARGKSNPFYGKKHRSETKRKLSFLNKGKKNAMYGKRHSAATKAKIRLARLRQLGRVR